MFLKSILLKHIQSNDSKTKIAIFRECRFSKKEIEALGNALRSNIHLEKLSFIGCDLNTESIKILAEALEHNYTLQFFKTESFTNDDRHAITLLQNIQKCIQRNNNESVCPKKSCGL